MLFALALSVPANAAPPRKIGRALVTYYWVIDETSSRYRGDRNVALRDKRGRVIACTTQRFKNDLKMEGTGWLRDGRTIRYDRRVGGETRFRITTAKYGIARNGRAVVPYRTVAVDPRFVKLGSTLCIPQLKGSRLPDGTIHDGIFRANDTGRFRGAHVDIFTNVGPQATKPFARRGYPSRSKVTVYVVSDADRGPCSQNALN